MPDSASRIRPQALEVERLGDHPDREDAQFASPVVARTARAGAGATAHARGDEDHVSPGQVVADLVDHLLGGGTADIRLRTRAEPFGCRYAHLDDSFGPRLAESLGIRVGDDKVDPLEPGVDHVVDGVSARPADAENGDPGP
jgi:hypothetical protein